MTNMLPPPEKLDLDGNDASVGQRWEKWKRSLEIYLDAAEIQTPVKKRATLLLLGGSVLQEIYYNLPGASVEPTEGIDVFKISIQKLDEYFLPKQSCVYERHVFRLIKQEEAERFEKFLVRLRKQATKCKFDKVDDHLIDQIAEKCASVELRKKILTIGDDITLERIVTEANTLEVVKQQLDDYEEKTKRIDINQIGSKDGKITKKTDKMCGRCGNTKHDSQYSLCVAKNQKCHSCGKIGHFARWCRSRKDQKRKLEDTEIKTKGADKPSDSKKARKDGRVNFVEKDVEYVFNIYNDDETSVKCMIGGVVVDMLVDSGCKVNLISDKTWYSLKKQNIKVSNQIQKPNKRLVPYGSEIPLNVAGSFEAIISTGIKETIGTFYVINGGTRDLLGKDSAVKLNVLKIGLGINQVEAKEFPKFKNVLVEIPIDDTIKPVVQPYRRIPIPLEQKVNEKIQELLDWDIIEEVSQPSRWVSPVVPILKENGELRLCVDMRRANAAILRENHPLPTMDNLLPKIGNAKFFTKIDIKNAFHQLELHPDSRHITTFITSRGLFQYKRLMFGITCAPEIFQKTLERMIIHCEGAVNFIDDILIYGSTETEHDRRVEQILKVLNENNVLLNENKCIRKVQVVNFLGHELSANGVKPLKKYIDSIDNFGIPKTIEELQSFLGLINYINKWIPNLATTTEPLKQLLRKKLGKNAGLEKYWKKEQKEAFDLVKKDLSQLKSLGYYSVKDKIQVIADASPVGIGAVLVQINSRGPRIIAYGNKTLTDCERRYSQTEKEALALVWAVEHFNIFLYGKEFDLITDHKPLEVIFGPRSKPCARVERWVLRLQSYRYKIKYQSGKSNIADPLSRLCHQNATSYLGKDQHVYQIVEQARPKAVSMYDIVEHSVKDLEIKNVKNGIYKNIWDDNVKAYKIFESELCFYDDVLLRGNRIVIPVSLRKEVLDSAHEGHPGIAAMKGRLRSKVWWPRIDRDAESVVRGCKGCTLVGAPNPPMPMKRRELPSAPWVDVAIDLLGPLPSNDYLLVIIDYYSRYKEIKITKSIMSSQIIKILKEIFSRLGYPVSITADNGRQFISTEFRSFLQECNITLYNTVPYWPQQNGEVERQNRDILKRLKIGHIEKKDLRESLYEYLLMYNATPHSVTGKSPSELFFKRQCRDKIPSIRERELEDDSEVRDKDKEQKERGKEYGDKKRRAKESQLVEGDKVYVKEMESNKLSLNYNPTPHVVENRSGGDVTVRNEETGQTLRRNVVHLKRVEGKWTSITDNENEDIENL
ncbi:uncharacterized protein K02A2.6-like [Spodoptera litura]|uniref:RNA-directed DNA polymerase n=1 Tax=Spodoptera litura TaxID=69820 RepID=A0A9J7ISW1_SPOLT|nr:uncharacterized protein K02A2.6-like [Spodoptera litura]